MSGYPTEVSYDDIDAIYVDTDLDREGEVFQLEPGPLGLHGRLAALPDTHIYEWSYGRRIMGREVRRDETMRVFVRRDKGPPQRINGREFPAEVPHVRLGAAEVDWIAPRDVRLIEIDVAAHLVDAFGWHHVRSDIVLRAHPEAVNGLLYMAGLIASFFHANPGMDQDSLRAIQDRLLAALGGCLETGPEIPPTSMEVARAGKLFIAGHEFLESRDPGERLSVSAMAAALDTAERTLYKAFQYCVGMGPYEFDMLRRMHVFRTDLIRRGPGRGRVQAAAQMAGFSDHSRLAQQYRRHFAESPSASARRWDFRTDAVRPRARRGGTS